MKDFFYKGDQIRKKPRIWSHLPKKSFMGNLFFCGCCRCMNMDKIAKSLR